MQAKKPAPQPVKPAAQPAQPAKPSTAKPAPKK